MRYTSKSQLTIDTATIRIVQFLLYLHVRNFLRLLTAALRLAAFLSASVIMAALAFFDSWSAISLPIIPVCAATLLIKTLFGSRCLISSTISLMISRFRTLSQLTASVNSSNEIMQNFEIEWIDYWLSV